MRRRADLRFHIRLVGTAEHAGDRGGRRILGDLRSHQPDPGPVLRDTDHGFAVSERHFPLRRIHRHRDAVDEQHAFGGQFRLRQVADRLQGQVLRFHFLAYFVDDGVGQAGDQAVAGTPGLAAVAVAARGQQQRGGHGEQRLSDLHRILR